MFDGGSRCPDEPPESALDTLEELVTENKIGRVTLCEMEALSVALQLVI